MRLIGLTSLLLAVAATAVADPVIWKCEDLKKLKEFSSIQCAPDAELYIVDPTNAGQVGSQSHDRRYIEFLNRHRIEKAEPKVRPSSAPTPPPPERREGRNLDQFKSYSVTR